MAWSTPHTWSAGEVGSASLYNNIRDQLDAAGGAGKAACRVYNNAALSIPGTGTATSLTFNSELYDRQACHSTVTNTGRITVPTGWGGLWLFTGHVEFAANSTGYREVQFLGNGVALTGSISVPAVASPASTRLSVSTVHIMSQGDWMELAVIQNSGSTLNVNATPNVSPQFTGIWLSA